MSERSSSWRKSSKRAGALPRRGDPFVRPLVRDLADAGDLAVRLRLEVEQVPLADQADADEPDADAIVGADHAPDDAAVASALPASVFRNARRCGMGRIVYHRHGGSGYYPPGIPGLRWLARSVFNPSLVLCVERPEG